jgi:hypothetical protein
MEQYRVAIPEERYSLVQFRHEDLPGVGVINQALVSFEPKAAFRWHLSLILRLEELIQNGMPSRAESSIVDAYGDSLDAIFKGDVPEKPNALFLARLTWNKTRRLVYRVFDPVPINEHLSEVIASKSHPRQFDFRIEPDPEWKLAQWHLRAAAEPA